MKLFDLDGTLLDSNAVWLEIDKAFLKKRGMTFSPEYQQGVIHAIFPAAAAFTKAFCRLEESEEEIMAEWMSMAYHYYDRILPLKEGVLDYLRLCAEGQEPMAIFTSAQPDLCRAALRHHGLESFFPRIIFAQELGMDKRSPEAFLRAAALLDTSPQEITFFDDSPVACLGAAEAGFTVIGVYDPLFAHQQRELETICSMYITSFTQLLPSGSEDA